MLNKLVKFAKPIAIIFWLVPFLLLALLASDAIGRYGFQNGLLTIVFIGVFYTLPFIVNIPNLVIILVSLFVLKTKTKQKDNYFSVALISNLLITVFTLIAFSLCSADYYCRTSDAPLGTAYGWIFYFYLGNLFWTLPFSFVINKASNFIYHRNESNR